MVQIIAPLVGAALFLSGLAAAAPTNSESNSNSYGGSSKDNSNSNYDSSKDNSNYGSSKDNSNYGGSSNDNSNYEGNSNYGNNNNYDSSSSSSSYESTSSYNNNYDSSSSSSSYESTSTYENNKYETSSTTSAYNSYQTSNYGSGSSYWGGSGYEDCVNQCIAQFGGGETGGGSYQATQTSGSGGSSGSNGATHTIIVAPHKGLFRMVPFATNASVGDTIEFHWGADQHTVTMSSSLEPCNHTEGGFQSGEQNTGFVFSQVVNNTDPTFFYCGTATHCQKGMFGVINPAQATPGAPSSFSGMMQSMATNDSDLSAYAAYSSNLTTNNAAAAKWGSNFDLTNIPEESRSAFVENVLFTRGVIGMNKDILAADNSIDLKSVAANPLMFPVDISQNLNAAASAPAPPAATDGGAAAPAGAAQTAPPAASESSKPNGASSVASPRLLVAAAVVVATIFAL